MTRPLLVGTGRCGDAADPTELITRAVFAAADDAGSRALLAQVQQISMPRGSWPSANPAAVVAERIGARSARTVIAEVGVPQQTLVSRTVAAIRAGELSVALVVGGEARAWAAAQRKAGASDAAADSDQPADEVLTPGRVIVSAAEIAARFWEPVQQYATIDQALLRAEGGGVVEIDELWARCNAVAVGNPHAAFREPRTAGWLRTAGPENRPLAAPYRKWHSTQWTVDQAAALLLCSEEAARAAGIDPARVVHPRVALESSFLATLPERRDLHRWPAMAVLGAAATAALGGRSLDSIEHIEVYSCFPAAVRVQQRELGLPLDGTPTITGGMAFAGGPFNNFTYQATAAMVERLRAEPGSLGMVTTVSGLLTKPGLMVWSTEPAPDGVTIADLAEQAAAATPTVEVVVDAAEPGRVLSATAVYVDDAPSEAIAIIELADGRRAVARSDDAALAAAADAGRLIDAAVVVNGASFRG